MEKYTFQAATAVSVSQKSLRDGHAKFAPKPVPCDEHASLEELREENQRLRQQLKRAEREREILKKATGIFCEGVAVLREHREICLAQSTSRLVLGRRSVRRAARFDLGRL